MAEVGFVVQVPGIPASLLGTMIAQSLVLEQDIAQDVAAATPNQVRCIQIAKSDSVLVIQPVDPTNYTAPAVPSDRTSSRAVKKHSATIAGATAGDHTVTGITTKNTLIAVVHVDDTTHAGTDKTSEYTISAANTINNTSGTSSASAHIVAVWI